MYLTRLVPKVTTYLLSDSFGPRERKELEYLLSKETAKADKFKINNFIKNDPWRKWEKRENYNALQRWLHYVSPIIKETPSTKDKP